MLFQKGELTVRYLEKNDDVWLAKWLSDPIVLEFYDGRDNSFDLERVHNVFYNREDGLVRCVIEFGGIRIGYIQVYPLDQAGKTEYGYEGSSKMIYATDQFIGETDYWNRGIGTTLIQSMLEYLVQQKKADIVVMDPQASNKRALHCYEKCGFQKVKYLTKHELHEGEWRDCWVIEYTPPEKK